MSDQQGQPNDGHSQGDQETTEEHRLERPSEEVCMSDCFSQ